MKKDNYVPKNEKEPIRNIDDLAYKLDEQHLLELNNLKQLQEIKNEIFKLESTRLKIKHGEKHPWVLKTDARLKYNQEMFSALDQVIVKAKIKQETLPINTWRVHGIVFDKKNIPVTGVTVFLSDQKKIWIKATGSICTNETGYYSLTVDAALAEGYEKKKQPLYVSVSDKNKKVIYLALEPLYAKKGLIDYLDVYLNDKECVSPPTETVSKEKKSTKDK